MEPQDMTQCRAGCERHQGMPLAPTAREHLPTRTAGAGVQERVGGGVAGGAGPGGAGDAARGAGWGAAGAVSLCAIRARVHCGAGREGGRMAGDMQGWRNGVQVVVVDTHPQGAGCAHGSHSIRRCATLRTAATGAEELALGARLHCGAAGDRELGVSSEQSAAATTTACTAQRRMRHRQQGRDGCTQGLHAPPAPPRRRPMVAHQLSGR